MAVDSLPTWQNKHKRRLETDDICPLCATEVEDNFHPFFRCPLARELWHTMAEVWSLPNITKVEHTGKECLLHVLEPMPEVERSMLLMTLWRTWHVRNEVVHHKPPPLAESSKRFLVSYLDSLLGLKTDICMDLGKGKTPLTVPMVRTTGPTHVGRWKMPDAGWVKLNTDGSFSEDGGAGAGMVLRDDKGAIIFSSCRVLFSCREALEAELCACMEGLSLSIQCTDLPIIVEMDSMVAMKMIQAHDVDRSLYSAIVREILRRTCITLVSRSQNKVSDSLASFARVEGRTMTWIGSRPSVSEELALADCNIHDSE